LEQYEYDASGQPYFYDANGNSIGVYDAQGRWAGYSLFGNRFLFTGREWLGEVKLYDYRNRMYQPELGRFLQPDPKEFEAGDYNLYRYCHNDPINKSDPTGLAYVSGLTSWGGGDWSSGLLGITNRERDLTNAQRMEAFLMRPESQKAARDAATASHTTGTEYGRAVGQSEKNERDLKLGPMTENTQDPGAPDGPVKLTTNGRHGVYNGTDFKSKPLPKGYKAVGGIWGLARHQRWWPTGDRRALWTNQHSGLLGIPAEDGHSQPIVLPPYVYIPGSPPPPND
jgi:RHS repeat-associated protein